MQRAFGTIAILLLLLASGVSAREHVRINQLGYLPDDPKIGRLLAYEDHTGRPFRVVRAADGVTVLEGTVEASTGAWGSFGYSHTLDFTRLHRSGWYRVVIGDTRSPSFAIATPPYASIAETLLGFFGVQRCGDTDPALHRACHLDDGREIENEAFATMDLTGGWHDAGDYTKFLTSASYATYLLLLTEEIRPGLAGDRDRNGRSDLLDEARVGADWCLRLRYMTGRYVRQVQDNRDHAVGWRLPENDPLVRDRPAFEGVGRSHLGRLAATLACAARAFAPSEPAWAESCRAAAEEAYAAADFAPPLVDCESYRDTTWLDKMALGAIELYRTTGEQRYLDDARGYADQAGPGYWFNWAKVNGLAQARLAPWHAPALESLEKDLIAFRHQSETHPWGMAGTETWGTTLIVAGAAIEALLFEELTGRDDYTPMAFTQRDFLFGTNPWGVCFVGGLGAVYPRDFHHQVARLVRRGWLRGAVTEGPAPPAVLEAQQIHLADADEYAEFQSERGVYHDDRNDYVTNEPTLSANAMAVLLMGLFDAREALDRPATTANATQP
jgi:hypothetical protein